MDSRIEETALSEDKLYFAVSCGERNTLSYTFVALWNPHELYPYCHPVWHILGFSTPEDREELEDREEPEGGFRIYWMRSDLDWDHLMEWMPRLVLLLEVGHFEVSQPGALMHPDCLPWIFNDWWMHDCLMHDCHPMECIDFYHLDALSQTRYGDYGMPWLAKRMLTRYNEVTDQEADLVKDWAVAKAFEILELHGHMGNFKVYKFKDGLRGFFANLGGGLRPYIEESSLVMRILCQGNRYLLEPPRPELNLDTMGDYLVEWMPLCRGYLHVWNGTANALRMSTSSLPRPYDNQPTQLLKTLRALSDDVVMIQATIPE
ncbi:hypothetical protein HD806DRAFT_518550 [Xylariaceae sp. AK1471]|nr:hypothetical protein HD806DRAFT_518550 [Xylariaceae sp. AK1471]